MLTVRQLIELLEKVPPSTKCYVEGTIGGIPIRESVASTSPCEKMVKKRWPDAVVKRFVDYYRVFNCGRSIGMGATPDLAWKNAYYRMENLCIS